MAVYDHRTFEWKNEWWAAQVHGGTGAGAIPAESEELPRITDEMVIFTCLSDRDRDSQVAHIPAGWLHRMGHRAIGRVLDNADSFGHRMDMSSYNTPDADEFPESHKFEDDEGLSWGARRMQTVIATAAGPEIRPGVELVCLDDSALRGEVPFENSQTLEDFLDLHGKAGVKELAKFVKSRYKSQDELEEAIRD